MKFLQVELEANALPDLTRADPSASETAHPRGGMTGVAQSLGEPVCIDGLGRRNGRHGARILGPNPKIIVRRDSIFPL
jgi:hypothetical protein